MSSGEGRSINGKGNNGIQLIPATWRKMVESLKEIVDYPEHEIYAMLKECNMDPNDTVHRLLSQDPFHEVKSRREKKKEIKETTESRSRGVSSTSNLGSGDGTDRNIGCGGSFQFNSSETGVFHGKPAYKKENEADAFSTFLSSASGTEGNGINLQPTYLSDFVTAENTPHTLSMGDGVSSSSQPCPGLQSAWLGVRGQLSMADIVKMGRPHSKSSRTQVVSNETYSPHNAVILNHSPAGTLPADPHHDLHSSQDPASKISEVILEPVIATSQHVSHDEWPLDDQSLAASGSAVLKSSAASEVYADPFDLHTDRANQHLNYRASENLSADCIGSASESSRHMHEDASGGTSHFDDTSFKNINLLQSHRHAYEPQEGTGGSSHLSIPNYSVSSVEDVRVALSSVAARLNQLNLRKEQLGEPAAEDNPAVIIPNHLQFPTADCSHLSFGNFGSGISSRFSESFASKPLKSNLEEVSVAVDASSLGQSESRNPEYYEDELLRSTSDGHVAPGASSTTGSFESPSLPKVMKQYTGEPAHGPQYTFPSSVPGYMFDNTPQKNSPFSYMQANSQMQNLTPFSSVMPAYTNSLPNNLLASAAQPARESEIPYSTLLAAQAIPTKYSITMSSTSGPTISMSEAVRQGGFSTQPTAQTLPGTSIATGPALPQHLTMHPYSLPLGHLANMIGYPFPSQSYSYLPSSLQQAYASSNAYHQSPATAHSAGINNTHPQYKNSASTSSLPQSAVISPGYGSFGSSTNIPGGIPLNPSSNLASTTIGYDDFLRSRYKDGNQFVPLQQNESTAIWVHGPGSRTVSTLPASTYDSFQGQSQQHGGFRQGQQPSPHYGSQGHPNFYHSQLGSSQEHPQQNSSDGTEWFSRRNS